MTPLSPGMNRLDRILDLVTEHEATCQQQELKIAELAQRLAGQERKTAQQLQPLLALKERDVISELDMARTAVEAVVRQLATMNRSQQATQTEIRRAVCQQQQQWQQDQGQQLEALTAEVRQLAARLGTVQEDSAAALEQLRTATRLHLEAAKQEREEQIESLREELHRSQSLAVGDAVSSSRLGLEEVRGWARSELLNLTANMKAVVTSCSNHQDQMGLQMEALQQQWENTQGQVEQCSQDTRKLKKHTTRLQNGMEELQRLGQAAIASEVGMQHIQQQLQQLKAANQQLVTRLEVLSSSTQAAGMQLESTQQRLHGLEGALATTSRDLTCFADNVGGVLAAARQASAVGSSSSYLSALLAPGQIGGAAGGGGGEGGGVMLAPQAAWEQKAREFDEFVLRMKQRLTQGQQQQMRLLVSSPGKSFK